MTATFYVDAELTAGSELTLSEDAAHHARVRRLAPDEPRRLTNGRGTMAKATLVRLDKKVFRVEVGQLAPAAPRPTPLTLLVPIADRDRTLWLAEKACELQVTRWIPVMWARSRNVSPRAEGDAFTAKVRARMVSALEQSAGAWLPEIAPALEPGEVDAAAGGALRLLLDAEGAPFPFANDGSTGQGIAIALGPEGGLVDAERDALLASGWAPWRIGSTTLRFETAAVAALAVVRAVAEPNTRSVHG